MNAGAMNARLPAPSTARRTLPLLAAVFLLPMAVGSGLFWSGWRPAQFGNHGELLQPARPLPDGGLLRTDGRPLPTAELLGKWLFVFSAPGACDAMCIERLQQLQRVHIALNKEQSRLRRVFIGRSEAWRDAPTASGKTTVAETVLLAGLIGGAGLWLLYTQVNALTMWLTLATFLGYAVIYTLLLKPAPPMNIVIGGASGAMPQLLGWTAMTGSVGPEALILFLIIFMWTPPHFWALACYRRDEYAKAGLPMLPVTHGVEFTCLHSLLYVVMLSAATVLPYTLSMSGIWYLSAVLVLDAVFLAYALALWRNYSDALARRCFRWSIIYLTILFAALLADHFA